MNLHLITTSAKTIFTSGCGALQMKLNKAILLFRKALYK